MDASNLEGGFKDPPRAASHVFRALMTAMARPGTIHDIEGARPPAPMSVAAGSALLTLCDPDTPIYLAGDMDTPALRAWIAFYTGAPITDRAGCSFAFGRWDALLPLDTYRIGTPEYPDRSATLIVECTALTAKGTALRGPGIRETAALNLPDQAAFAANNARFPLGLDFYFTADTRIVALPRSTRIG